MHSRFFSVGRFLVIALLMIAILSCCLLNNSLAWLSDAPENNYVNLFTGGQLNITLTGAQQNRQLIPGVPIILDPTPTVTVPANSPSCYVFLKMEDVDTTGLAQKDYVGCPITGNWTLYGGGTQDKYLNYFYATVPTTNQTTTLPILYQLNVNSNLTLSSLQELDAALASDSSSYVGVKIDACAVQTAGQTLESAYTLALAQFES